MKPIEQAERYTLSKLVVQNLQQYIIDNQLNTGDKLPAERQLSEFLNVSRAILREALRSLESCGIVEIRHGEGTFVANRALTPLLEHLSFAMRMPGAESRDLQKVRYLLESAAIDIAADPSNGCDFDELERLAGQVGEKADVSFHLAVIQTIRNDTFLQLAELFIRQAYQGPGKVESPIATEEHQRYVEALRLNNPQEAKRILRKHLGLL